MPSRQLSAVDRIVIHCAATPNGKDIRLSTINRIHRENGFKRDPIRVATSKWDAVGYHAVICLDGEIQHGRDLDEVPASEPKWNTRSLAVCLIGTDKFTKYQWESLKHIVSDWEVLVRAASGMTPQIIGHYKISAKKKECPCFDVDKWLEIGREPVSGHLLGFSLGGQTPTD